MFYAAFAISVLFLILWLAQLIFVKLHLNWTNRILKSYENDQEVAVSIIHPIKDLDYELEKNLESWFLQDYKGPIEHIFSFQQQDDPAIQVVKDFLSRYPQIPAQIIVNPVIPGLNGKSSNMVNAMKISRHDIVLFGDSDVRLKPDFITKMVRPLKDDKVGITTCGQINIGGSDFWTRFFTFLQNNETIFLWSFLVSMGLDVGATGAAFAMRKKLLIEIGGLEAFGGSLLEDMHLGNTLFRKGYKLVLGPYLECHVKKLSKEKSLNYAKRICIGLKTHLAVEFPSFILLLFWYWILFILGLIFGNEAVLYLSFVIMSLRTIQGIFMRIITRNKFKPVDIIMGLFFDLFGTFYLIYSLNNPFVSWRGIKYELKKGGFIRAVSVDTEYVEEKVREL